MGNRANKPASSATCTEINKVAIISSFERVDPNPDNLTLLKRKVEEFDQLKISSEEDWEDAVELVDDRYKLLFQGGNFDQLRFRYHVYGLDEASVEHILDHLTTALP